MKEDREIMAQFYIKLLYYFTSTIFACTCLSMFRMETDYNLKKTGPQLFQRVIPVLVKKLPKNRSNYDFSVIESYDICRSEFQVSEKMPEKS